MCSRALLSFLGAATSSHFRVNPPFLNYVQAPWWQDAFKDKVTCIAMVSSAVIHCQNLKALIHCVDYLTRKIVGK